MLQLFFRLGPRDPNFFSKVLPGEGRFGGHFLTPDFARRRGIFAAERPWRPGFHLSLTEFPDRAPQIQSAEGEMWVSKWIFKGQKNR